MLREIQQVLRLVMLLGKQRQQRCLKTAGGLLVLFWTDAGASVHGLNCTVAAAGPRWTRIKMEALQLDLTDLKESMFPCVWSCPQPDPEELCALTDLYGSLKILLSFQVKDKRLFSPGWCNHIEAFLHTFSLTNAGIRTHLKLKLGQQALHRGFRVKMRSRVALANQPSLILDVTSTTEPPGCVKTGCWCLGGHPVLGGKLPLSIPPEAMDQGLFGELSVQPITLLSPCVQQYPNLATQLTHIQVLVCSPSNVPVTGPSTFLQNLPSHLDCQELGLHGIHCSSFTELIKRTSRLPKNIKVPSRSHGWKQWLSEALYYLVHSGGIVYTVERENCEDSEEESRHPSVQQSLLLLLLLQHNDPFTCQLSDIMATETLIERYLEDILNNNRQAVTAALQTELKNTLKTLNSRKKVQEELCAAAEVILSSCISIVSCSSNIDFRNACLNSMKVRDTHDLSASLRESLRRVTSWKFIPRGRCFSTEMDNRPETDDLSRTEI